MNYPRNFWIKLINKEIELNSFSDEYEVYLFEQWLHYERKYDKDWYDKQDISLENMSISELVLLFNVGNDWYKELVESDRVGKLKSDYEARITELNKTIDSKNRSFRTKLDGVIDNILGSKSTKT